MNLQIKEIAKKILNHEKKLSYRLKKNLAPILGNVIGKPLIQFYRNDDVFKTIVSLNHFINFFSNIENQDIIFYIDFFDRNGIKIGNCEKRIQKKGCLQFELGNEINEIDQFGIFSVHCNLLPKYDPEINYLGALNPQYMTMYIPTDMISSVQMIHSHKVLEKRSYVRSDRYRFTNHIEEIENTEKIEIYTLNSSSSVVSHGIRILDSSSLKLLHTLDCKISGHGVNKFVITQELLESFKSKSKSLSFQYHYDLNINHKKPILFRMNKKNIWTANHT